MYKEKTAHWVAQCTEKRPTRICTWTQERITTQRTTSQCCPSWHRGPQPYATRTVSKLTWMHFSASFVTTYIARKKSSAFCMRHSRSDNWETYMTVAYLPFVQNTFNSISRVLSKHTSRLLAYHPEKFRNATSRQRRPGSQICRLASAANIGQTVSSFETRTTPTREVSSGGTRHWSWSQDLAQ
jgi:hypothetical protein